MSSFESQKKKKYHVREIDSLDYNDEIKKKAQELALKLSGGKTKKHMKKNYLIFLAIKRAHEELGMRYDDINIAKNVGLGPKDITQAYSTFSKAQTGYSPCKMNIDSVDLLDDICHMFGFNKDFREHFTELARKIFEANSELRKKKINNVAASFFVYLCDTNHFTYDMNVMIEKSNAKKTSIDPIVKMIKETDLQLSALPPDI
jgi:hypothetical protein